MASINSDFLRREWGAVAFLVTTALGIIVVPVGLSLARKTAPSSASLVTTASPSPVPSASAAPSASPSPGGAASPGPSPSPAVSPSPAASPAASTPSPSPS